MFCALILTLFHVWPAFGVVGSDWHESAGGGDAGAVPSTAQIPLGTGPLTSITGDLFPGDFEDMYRILITDPSSFSATTDIVVFPTGWASFDTQLWLFDEGGHGQLANDDCTLCVDFHSLLTPASTDGSGFSITEPGVYYLAISGFNHDPQSAFGPIFDQLEFTEVSGPDGPGGSLPVDSWFGFGEMGSYTIGLSGAAFAQDEVAFDCDGIECYESPGGAYGSLFDCQSECAMVETFFECDGFGCFEDPFGSYSSLSACESQCGSSFYECDGFSCFEDPFGSFVSLSECQSFCGGGGTFFTCISPGSCIEDPTGEYPSMEECELFCSVSESWSCDGGGCIQDPEGIYGTLVECQAACEPPTLGWDCIGDVAGCVEIEGGPYPSQAVCEANCAAQCPCPEVPPARCELDESPPERPAAKPCDTCNECGNDNAGVYGHSGESKSSTTDLVVPGRGTDFQWARKYRHRMGTTSAQGNGWDNSYNVSIERCGNDRIVCDGNSRRDRFTDAGDGSYQASEFFQQLTEEPDGTLTMTFDDQGKWRFNALDGSVAEGKLSQSEDRNGNVLTYGYDANGRMTAVTDTLGRSMSIQHDENGRIESVTDHTGRQVQYSYYDGIETGGNEGDLKSVTTPPVVATPEYPVPSGHEFLTGKTTTYTYTTGFGDPTLNGSLVGITDAKGQTFTTNFYAHTIDSSDPRFTQSPDDLHFNRMVRQVIGNSGDIIDYYYAEVTPSLPNGFAVVKTIENDRMGNVTETYYDDNNRRVLIREYTGRANPDEVTTEAVNRPSNPLRPDDPEYYETRYEYNEDGLITRTVHPNGSETLNTYEGDINPLATPRMRGNLVETRILPGPLGGDQPELVETFEYDDGFGCAGCGSNFVTRHVDARGNETLHEYDAHGNRTHTQHRIPSIVEDFEYNEFGQMIAQVHPDNGTGHRRRDEITYYDSGPQLGFARQKIIDVGNEELTTTYEYNIAGQLTREIDPKGNDTLFVVNQLDQIVRSTSREVDAGGPRYFVDTFYDANDNVVRLDVQNVDETGTVVATNPVFTTIFEYDVLNQTTRACQESGSFAVPSGQTTCAGLPDSEFVITEYEYDDNWNQSIVRTPEAVNGRQLNNVIRTIYDERDLKFQVTAGLGSADQSTIQYDYDLSGNLSRTSHGIEDSPRVTVMTYDGYDRLSSTTDPMGNVTEFQYDANGNVGGEQSSGVPNTYGTRVFGELVDVAGAVDNIRLYQETAVYDAMDRKVQKIVEHFNSVTQAPIGDGLAITTFEFTPNSQISRVIDDNGHQATSSYDTVNRLSSITDQKGNVIVYEYDQNSKIVTQTETDQSDLGAADEVFVTTLQYDNLNRVVKSTDHMGHVNEYRYDSRHNRVVQVDALRDTPGDPGNVTRMHYDGLNRLVRTDSVLTDDGTGDGNVTGQIVTQQVYDDNSRLVTRIDDAGNATTHEYDVINRVTRAVFADGTTTTTQYDVHNNAVQSIDANGSVVAFEYDTLNRLTLKGVTPAVGVSGDISFESLLYDGLSRMVRAEDDDSIVNKSHDSMSNMTAETLNGETTVSSFDAVKRRTNMAYPGGRTLTWTYDQLDRPATVGDAGGNIATWNYIGMKRVEIRTLRNDTTFVPIYDDIRRIVRTTHEHGPSTTTIDDRAYTWNAMHNKLSRSNLLEGGAIQTFEYDSLHRLTRSITTPDSGPVQTKDYGLDGVGNRAPADGYVMDALAPPADASMNQYTDTPTGRQEYDANGNLVHIGSPGDADGDGDIDLVDFGQFQLCFTGSSAIATPPCRRLDYDNDGDVDLVDFGNLQLTFGEAVPAVDITYDYRNQMVAYHDRTANRLHEYKYDALGRRIAKIVDANGFAGPPVETRYFYDGWKVIEEQDAGGMTSASYVVGHYLDDVITMNRGGVDLFYHADDQFSVIALTDGFGNVVERYEYSDFGQSIVTDASGTPLVESAIGNPYRFTGRRFDDETGWYFFRTRYLDPAVGQFTTRDTIGIWGDLTNLGNGRTYCGNNPWSCLDPTGLLTKKECDQLDREIERYLNDWRDNLDNHIGDLADNAILAVEKLHKFYSSATGEFRSIAGGTTGLLGVAASASTPASLAVVALSIGADALANKADGDVDDEIDIIKKAILGNRTASRKKVQPMLEAERKLFDKARAGKPRGAKDCCPDMEAYFRGLKRRKSTKYKAPPAVDDIYANMLLQLAQQKGWSVEGSTWYERNTWGGFWTTYDWGSPGWTNGQDVVGELRKMKWRPPGNRRVRIGR
jgi:RHS repeat-associated protein